MISTTVSSHTGNQNFDFSSALPDNLPKNIFPSFSNTNNSSKINQNYFQFRSAEFSRDFTNNKEHFSFPRRDKPTLIFEQSYAQKKAAMENRYDIQDYCRFRDSNYRTYNTSLIYGNTWKASRPYSSHRTKENEYSKHRDAQSNRSKSIQPERNCPNNHFNCRNSKYDSEATRFPVPDSLVPWSIEFLDYQPVEYTTKKVLKNPKADLSDPSTIHKFNQIDGQIDRQSFTGIYFIDPVTNRPRNPVGRTGMTGRGRLYYWGPNHAGDPVVTRWKRNENGLIVHLQSDPKTVAKPVLEFVSIQRRDTQQWALPGGMVDPGEGISQTVVREFQEEAGRLSIDGNLIKRLFSNGFKLREFYVDDPRNTDNAWMETIAMHYHDETGYLTKDLNLNAGDDAEKVCWHSIDRNLQLYATHKDIIKAAVDRLDAFW